MTYVKPEDVTYTQMCMWIDQNAYTSDKDEIKMYEYLYHISVMLINKNSLYTDPDVVDQFGLYCSSKLFLRIVNPKQYELDSEGREKLPKIKSILNYTKNVIHHYKVDYELEFNVEDKNLDVVTFSSNTLSQTLSDDAYLFDMMDFSFTIESISSIVRSHLSRIPYKKHSSEWLNIYTSCMLTLLDSVTLNRDMIETLKNSTNMQKNSLNRMYDLSRYADPILYHLPKSMSNYIRVLVNEIRHVIVAELRWKSSSRFSVETTIKELLAISCEENISGD